jgi:hypothetical protein
MAEVVPDAHQEFWRPPVASSALECPGSSPNSSQMLEVCGGCGSEFMIAARYCHTCGHRRSTSITSIPSPRGNSKAGIDRLGMDHLWTRAVEAGTTAILGTAAAWRRVRFPSWMKYLHFHEIQRLVGLPTGSLIAFFIGLGCVAGAIGVSLFYRATNLAEFQAIQMWRIEWLLGATASFVAAILLKRPPDSD